MKFAVANRIRSLDPKNPHEGVILRVSEREGRYYVSWLDDGKRRVHTKDFLEEKYELIAATF